MQVEQRWCFYQDLSWISPLVYLLLWSFCVWSRDWCGEQLCSGDTGLCLSVVVQRTGPHPHYMSDKRGCVFVSLRVSACECVCVQYLESAKRAVKLSASVLYTSSVKDVNSSSRSSKCKRCIYVSKVSIKQDLNILWTMILIEYLVRTNMSSSLFTVILSISLSIYYVTVIHQQQTVQWKLMMIVHFFACIIYKWKWSKMYIFCHSFLAFYISKHTGAVVSVLFVWLQNVFENTVMKCFGQFSF